MHTCSNVCMSVKVFVNVCMCVQLVCNFMCLCNAGGIVLSVLHGGRRALPDSHPAIFFHTLAHCKESPLSCRGTSSSPGSAGTQAQTERERHTETARRRRTEDTERDRDKDKERAIEAVLPFENLRDYEWYVLLCFSYSFFISHSPTLYVLLPPSRRFRPCVPVSPRTPPCEMGTPCVEWR